MVTGLDKLVPTLVTQSNCNYRVYEDSRLLGYDVVQFGRQTQFFVKNVVPLCSGQHNKPKPFVLFYFVALFFFLFSLTHSFLYPRPSLLCQFTQLQFCSSRQMLGQIISLISITFNPEDGDSIYLRNTYISVLN